MSERERKAPVLIGLHPLSNVDGIAEVPELQALMSHHEARVRASKVIDFPKQATRRPGKIPTALFERDAAKGQNVVAFRLPKGKSRVKFRRA